MITEKNYENQDNKLKPAGEIDISYGDNVWLMKISGYTKQILDHLKSQEDDEDLRSEWICLALVLDRMVVYLQEACSNVRQPSVGHGSRCKSVSYPSSTMKMVYNKSGISIRCVHHRVSHSMLYPLNDSLGIDVLLRFHLPKPRYIADARHSMAAHNEST